MIPGEINQVRLDQLQREQQGFLDRVPDNRNMVLAQFLNKAANDQDTRSRIPLEKEITGTTDSAGSPLTVSPAQSSLQDAARMRALESIRQQLGVSAVAAKELDGKLIAPYMQRQDKTGLEAIAGAYAAAKNPGVVQQVKDLELQANQALAAPGMRGNIARGGLYAGIAGGAVAGGAALTEGAQQLIALMQYLQSGQQNEAAAENSPMA